MFVYAIETGNKWSWVVYILSREINRLMVEDGSKAKDTLGF